MEVLFTPADYEALTPQRLRGTVCVVFDVLRATSSMVTALYHGAAGVQPIKTVAEAVHLKNSRPDCLLAGERNGLRIRADVTGSVDFDLGNSPREFTPAVVQGKALVMTTTNGTRALDACRGADMTLICSFLNTRATAAHVLQLKDLSPLLICSGTGDAFAYEDVLGAGALVGLLSAQRGSMPLDDSALLAQRIYRGEENDLVGALSRSSNGRRLDGLPDLRDDLPFCAQRDCFEIVAGRTRDAPITLLQR